jgi:PAS domain S-box-containing protein
MGLLSYIPGLRVLGSVRTYYIPMAPATSICFIGLALILFMLFLRSPGKTGLVFCSAIALLIALFGLLEAQEYFTGMDISFEDFLFPVTGDLNGIPVGRMSPATGVGFTLSGLAVFLQVQRKNISIRTAYFPEILGIFTFATGTVYALAYLYGQPLMYGQSPTIPMAMTTSAGFILLGVAIAGTEAGFEKPFLLGVTFFCLMAVIITVGLISYKHYAQSYRIEAERQLQAVAELKVSELTQWRKERLGDGEIFYNNPVFSRLVSRFFEHPEDAESQQDLQTWLGKIREYHQYSGIFLLDTQAVDRLTIPSQAGLLEDASEYVEFSFRSGRVVFQDFHRHAPELPLFLGISVPVFNESNTNIPLAVLVLQIDPESYLYPFISRWPVSSQTAETLLVRREGDEVVFLSPLRFSTNAVFTMRSPLSDTVLPAVQAVLGKEGIFEGRDYRGKPVVAYLHAIQDSPWFMVARRDTVEIFAPIKDRLRQVSVMICILIFGVCAVAGMVWRHQRVRFYRQKAEAAEALRETNDYLESLIDCANAPIVVWDPQFRITRFNPAFEKLTGRSESDVLGLSLEILFPLEQAEKSMELIRKTLAGERWEELEIPIINSTGSIRTVLWNSATLVSSDGKTPVATIAQGHDITARKQAEDQVFHNEVRLKALVNVLQSRAETTQELLDHALNEAIGLTESKIGYIYFYHEDRQEFVLNTWSKEVMKECEVANPQSCYELDKTGVWGEAVRQRKPIILNDFNADNPHKKGYPAGHVHLFRFMTVPIFKHNQIVAVVGVANKATDYDESDVLQLTLLMDAVWKSVDTKTAEAALKETLEQLRVSNRDLEQFAYIASHDLQEPLRMVANYMQLLERRYKEKLDQDAKDFIGYAVDGAVRMQQLIDSLLEYSRLQTRKKPFETVELDKVIRRVLHDLEGRILDAGAQMTIDPLPQVVGDAIQLGLVFQNFISNALKFRGEASPEIHIAVEESSNHWKITVHDNGIGIEPEHYEKIFKIFQRLHSRADYPGTGIGLTICRRIIERHGGETGVESVLGKGSTFWFTLPKKGESSHGRIQSD